MKRIACVYLSNWPIQRLVAKQPELKRQRVLLYHHDVRGQRVSAASPAALRAGIRVGMSLSEARGLLKETAPTASLTSPIHFLAHDREADRAALERLAFTCESLAPRVGLESGPEPECIFLDVSGIAHLFGGEERLWDQIQRHFQNRGYWVRVAIAETLGAAWGLARFDGESDFGRLPIAALRLQPATRAILRQLGVERVEQIRRLQRADLWSRFGDELHRRLDQVSGAHEEIIDWLPPPSEFYAQRFLDFPTTDAMTIQVIVSGLVEQLCGELRARQRGGLQWRCCLYSPDADPLQWEINLFHPGAAARQVMPLIQMHLDQCGMGLSPRAASHGRQNFDQEFAVHHVSVSAPLTALLVDRQRLLFDQEPRLDRQQLVHLIDRLSTRLGAERVLGAELRAEAQPELACRLQPLIGPRPGAEVSSRAVSAGPLRRPLRLHAPLAIRVFSSGETGRPARISAGRDWVRVAAGWGPERIETGWWRGPMIRRDYWRVALEDGRWLWVFHDLSSDQWFCQGAF